MAGKRPVVVQSPTLRKVLSRRIGESNEAVFSRLGLAPSRSYDLMRGEDPGSTERLAVVAGRFLVPVMSERAAAWKVWQILRELHPALIAAPQHDASSAEAA
jgi:hypothetical protein